MLGIENDESQRHFIFIYNFLISSFEFILILTVVLSQLPYQLNLPKKALSMKGNKAVRMLKAAEEGGYGVIGVVQYVPNAN
jgi:hypothetical protein